MYDSASDGKVSGQRESIKCSKLHEKMNSEFVFDRDATKHHESI